MYITYHDNELTAAQYADLRESAGWEAKACEQISRALSASLLTVAAHDGEKTIGMARLIGDGAIYWHITEVVVLPEYQGRGVGEFMVRRLIDFARNNSILDTKISIGLMAKKNKEGFYEKLGFASRPDESHGAGMTMFVQLQKRE